MASKRKPKTPAQDTKPRPEDEAGLKLCAKWKEEITAYEQEFGAWEKSGDKVVKRYRAEKQPTGSHKRKYNILWSNVQTLQPALYFSAPKPNIERRYKDDDKAALMASEILERVASYFVNESAFHECAKNVVKDRLLPGRGVMWVRYVPHFKDMEQDAAPGDGVQVTDDVQPHADAAEADAGDTGAGEASTPQEALERAQDVEYEEAVFDFVYWKDFGHVVARTWAEVPGVWRKVYLAKDALKRRWPEKADDIPLDYTSEDAKKTDAPGAVKKATIYEIWDKDNMQVIWLHKDMQDVLQVLDDPLKIKDFYPCPKPLYATTTTESLIPVPDYIQYQDQARELDELTARISSITKSLKVAGVYDNTAEGLQQLLSEGLENKLIPIKSWALYAEKGGLAKAIEFLPIEAVAKVLDGLYTMRDKVKADLNEITGIADIIRGNSDPDDTAEAQHLKGQFATLRLSEGQNEVKQFMQEAVQIATEIIARHFNQKTLAEISGVKLMTDEEKKQWQVMQQLKAQAAAQQPMPQMPPAGGMGAMAGGSAPPQQPQSSPPQQEQDPEGLHEPSWEDVMKVLRNSPALCFKIDIETDSTIKQDQEADKKSRIEFVEMAGTAMQQLAAAQNPVVAKLGAKLLMFAVKGFKNARELESAFEDAIKEMEENPPQQTAPPDPAVIKAQSAEKIATMNNQVKMQTAQISAAATQQAAQTEGQAKVAKEQLENQAWTGNEQMKLSFQAQIAKMQEDAETQRQQMQQQFDAMLAAFQHHSTMKQQAAKPAPKPNGGNHA